MIAFDTSSRWTGLAPAGREGVVMALILSVVQAHDK
jgi:hypothetical protein